MGIKTVSGGGGKGKKSGDVGAPDKAKVKARLAQFSDVDNKRVTQAKMQASNGFKGESLNDHGLPDGHKSREIIQSTASIDNDKVPENAKFRKQTKYADGTKGIKLKPKTAMVNDATSVAPRPRNVKAESKAAATKEYTNAVDDYISTSRNAKPAQQDSLYNNFTESYGYNAQYDRDFPGNKYSSGKSKLRADSPSRVEADKISAARSKYASGTKGIKTKKMC